MNQGYGVSQGFGPGTVKKKNNALTAAIIILILVVIAMPIIILTAGNAGKPINNGTNVTDPVLAGNSGGPSAVSASPPSPADALAADGFRNNYTKILGGGKDVVTVMIYVCGADLESDSGCATLDFEEMLAADLGSNVNVIIETGGCTSWSTPGIKDGQVQRWSIEDGRLVELQDLGETGLLNPDQLSEFISYASGSYPANRYDLIFWDHGGGSLYGYGSDQLYPDTVLFLPDIAQALAKTDVKFDFVGFDACLMGSIETAYMLEPYADYLIASEETEPAYGWDYTPWLNALGANSSIDTVELGKSIVKSFMESNAPSNGEKGSADNTLSVVALREIPKLYEELCDYMSSASEALAGKEFKTISTAVSRSRSFAEGDYDLIDIGDFVKRADLAGQEEFESALKSAVKYSESTARTGVSGLSLYFPYTDLSVYSYAKEKFGVFGFGDEVYKFYDRFVNILAGGQKNSTSRSLKENLTGQQDAQADYSAYSWYDGSQVSSYTYDDINYTELEILQDETTGNWYLPLTDEDWSLLTDVQMQILMDDGGGYIDLGSDQYYETDDNGNLLLNFGSDNTWVAIGGQIVCYYAESTFQNEAGDVFIGYVPAVLGGETDIDIMLEWDGQETDGYIIGYRLLDTNSPIGGQGTLGKGYKQFKAGDTIDFVCDYYTYDGDFDTSYYFGDPMTIGDTLPSVTYEDIGNCRVLECYMLTDIYQNQSWTETVEFAASDEG